MLIYSSALVKTWDELLTRVQGKFKMPPSVSTFLCFHLTSKY